MKDLDQELEEILEELYQLALGPHWGEDYVIDKGRMEIKQALLEALRREWLKDDHGKRDLAGWDAGYAIRGLDDWAVVEGLLK